MICFIKAIIKIYINKILFRTKSTKSSFNIVKFAKALNLQGPIIVESAVAALLKWVWNFEID